MTLPTALAKQSCFISRIGKTITIGCDTSEEAEELFEFLTLDIFGGLDEDE